MSFSLGRLFLLFLPHEVPVLHRVVLRFLLTGTKHGCWPNNLVQLMCSDLDAALADSPLKNCGASMRRSKQSSDFRSQTRGALIRAPNSGLNQLSNASDADKDRWDSICSRSSLILRSPNASTSDPAMNRRGGGTSAEMLSSA